MAMMRTLRSLIERVSRMLRRSTPAAATDRAPARPPRTEAAVARPEMSGSGRSAPVEAADEATALANFVGLTQVLTGFSSTVFAPPVDPNPQPQQEQYFDFLADPANGVAADFAHLLALYQGAVAGGPAPTPGTPEAQRVGQALLDNAAVGPLARRIIKLWYTGSWYAEPPAGNERPANMLQVVTSQAYVNGLMWRVAQAHPMGLSKLRFGYWTSPPPALDKFTGVKSS